MILYARRSSAMVWMQCKESVIPLSCLWALGLVCGLYFVSASDIFLFELFHDASSSHPSFVGILVVTFLPIIISAIAAYFAVPLLIYALCFLKAFCFGFGLCGIVSVFGYSGWLIRLLLLFSDSGMAVLLFCLWCRILSHNFNAVHRDFLIITAGAAVIGTVDYFLVSPYLAMLMNYL